MKKSIKIQGRTYHYDPDYDCYYRQYSEQDLTHWDRWGWIVVIIALTFVCAAVSG